MFGLTVITPPPAEPFAGRRGLHAIKTQIQIAEQSTHHDEYLMRTLLPQVRRDLERELGRALITQTWRLTLDGFPPGILLPGGHVQSITAISYRDSAGDWQAIDSAEYRLIDSVEPAEIRPESPYRWPTALFTDRRHCVSVDYVVGYGDSGDDIPDELLGLMLRKLDDRYRHRGEAETPATPDAIVEAYRTPDVFTQYDRGTAPGVHS